MNECMYVCMYEWISMEHLWSNTGGKTEVLGEKSALVVTTKLTWTGIFLFSPCTVSVLLCPGRRGLLLCLLYTTHNTTHSCPRRDFFVFSCTGSVLVSLPWLSCIMPFTYTIRHKYPCSQWDSNPQSQQAIGPQTLSLDRSVTGIGFEPAPRTRGQRLTVDPWHGPEFWSAHNITDVEVDCATWYRLSVISVTSRS
jgi:hypothetical protein